MHADHVRLVQTSWAQVVPVTPLAATHFYERLFEIAPELRPLFSGDVVEQGRKLMTMLNTAVTRMDRLDELLPAPAPQRRSAMNGNRLRTRSTSSGSTSARSIASPSLAVASRLPDGSMIIESPA